MVLEIKNLSVNFKTENEVVKAIQNISFTLEKGKTLVLVGESGSGKSVSALSIMGLLPSPPAQIMSGSILFYENEKPIDLLKISSKEFESIRGNKIGFIFQEPMTSLNPLMHCGKQVAEVIQLHKKCSNSESIKLTLELFEEVKLPNAKDMLTRYPHELSGGQKQRVMIAMAISCNPDLLIADEPTTALDVTTQKTILELLKELQVKKKMAILFITHDLNLVRDFSDTVMVMNKSLCVEYNTIHELFSNPKELYTKGLLACRPNSSERVRYLKTVEELVNENNVEKSKVISELDFDKRIEDLNVRNNILSIENLQIWYPTQTNFFGKTTSWFKAVNGVNFKIREGETMGLVGESGCGKTTIGKAIVKLVNTTQGKIIYKNKNIIDFSKSELADYRKEVQIIFQDPYSSLNPRIPIGEAIKEPMDVHGILLASERKNRVTELLQKVGLLASHYDRYPHEFSGGQRQRICIARALALESKLIICDESVSALDVSVQAQVLNLLVSLRQEFNLSYLFISHDLGVVKHISDHVTVMQNGKIIETQNANKIYSNPQNEYTKELITSSIL